MTPRPPTHREPTDEEMQCLPEGSLVLMNGVWKPTRLADAPIYKRHVYAVPITKQEEAINWDYILPSIDELKTIYEAERKRQVEGRGLPAVTAPIRAVRDAMIAAIQDAMLAARNNQPEKV